MHMIVGVFDAGAGPILIRVDVLDQIRLNDIRQRDLPEIQGVSSARLGVPGNKNFQCCLPELRSRVAVGLVERLAVPLW